MTGSPDWSRSAGRREAGPTKSESGSSLRSKIPAGLVDAGAASVATFGVGLAAARILDEQAFGLYALFFAAYNFAAVVPRQLVLTPAEVAALDHPRAARPGMLPATVAYGLTLAPVTIAILVVVALFARGAAPTDVLVPLAISTALVSVVSPIQDHIRQMLHMSDRSWLAASMSMVQLAAVAVSIGVLVVSPIGRAWIPFLALFIANVISSTVGLVGVGVSATGRTLTPKLTELMRSGLWFLIRNLVPTGAILLASAIIAWLAGLAALGHAEAARLVAQPLLVLAIGVGTVIGPRIMEAGAAGDRELANRLRSVFMRVALGLGIVYTAITAGPWVFNPMYHLIPAAYTVAGLAAASLVANLLDYANRPYVAQLWGERRERLVAIQETIIGPLPVLLALTAALTGPFARPLGVGARGIARTVLFGRSARTPVADSAG